MLRLSFLEYLVYFACNASLCMTPGVVLAAVVSVPFAVTCIIGFTSFSTSVSLVFSFDLCSVVLWCLLLCSLSLDL